MGKEVGSETAEILQRGVHVCPQAPADVGRVPPWHAGASPGAAECWVYPTESQKL